MTGLEERIRAWSYRRQDLGRAAPDVSTALGDIVGAYASQPTAVLTLAARVRDLDPNEYRRLDAARSAVRLPAMRLSSHLLPTDRAARVFAATRRALGTLAWLWRGIGLSDAEYATARAAILAAASEPLTLAALRRRLSGGAASLLERHPQAGTLLVRAIRSEGLLVAIAPDSLRSNAFAYVSTEAWLGRPLDAPDPDEALTWLVGEYLRAFGPARVEDFRWWSGTTRERARAAIARRATVELAPGLLLPVEDRASFEAVRSADGEAIELLPLWDVYTMGYAPDGRHRFVRPGHQARAYDTGGNGLGLVLRAGLAVAAWALRFADRRMEVGLDPFDGADPRLRSAVEDRLRETAALLGATDLTIVEGPLRGVRGPEVAIPERLTSSPA